VSSQWRKAKCATPSVHTIIVGHAGSQLESNKDAPLALGIPQTKHKDLLLALSVNAVQRTHHRLPRSL
jgi:hypothetical protein